MVGMQLEAPPDHALAAWPHASVVDFAPPRGVSDDECGHAFVLVSVNAMGGALTREHRAFFEPTADDLERLNEGGHIVITLVGTSLQPFACDTFPAALPDHEPAV